MLNFLILLFLFGVCGGGELQRVEIRNLWAVERYRAWKFAISGRWNVAARGILQFLSGGTLPRVGFCIFWAVERCSAWDSAIFELWSLPARGMMLVVRCGALLRVG